MKVCKYKVGDKVKVVKPPVINSSSSNGSYNCWNVDMDDEVGKEKVIKELDNGNGYRLESTDFGWLEEWLEPVDGLSSSIICVDYATLDKVIDVLGKLSNKDVDKMFANTKLGKFDGDYYKDVYVPLKVLVASTLDKHESQFIKVQGKKYKKDEYEKLMEKQQKELEELKTY